MILRNELTLAGRVNKTHGVDGEMSVSFFQDIVDDPDGLRCIVMDMDGIFVPFFITGSRPRGSEAWLITLEGIDSQEKAAQFTGKDVWILTREIPSDDDDSSEDETSDGLTAEQLIGFTLFDGDAKVGVITDLNLDTANALFVVERPDGEEILIPIADEFITDINTDNSSITMDLPIGLIE